MGCRFQNMWIQNNPYIASALFAVLQAGVQMMLPNQLWVGFILVMLAFFGFMFIRIKREQRSMSEISIIPFLWILGGLAILVGGVLTVSHGINLAWPPAKIKQVPPSEQQGQSNAKEIAKEIRKELRPDLEELVSKFSKSHREELDSQFPDGFVVFGILKSGEPIIPGFVPKGVYMDWKTGGVTNVGKDTVTFDLPKFRIEGRINHAIVKNVTLPRKTGFVCNLIKAGDIVLQLKIMTDVDPVIIAMGFVKIKEEDKNK